MKTRLFLASQSPRRKALLESVHITPIVLAPDPSTDAEALEMILPGESPLAYVERVARLKRDHALARLNTNASLHGPAPNDLVLSADTTVAFGQTILSKPSSPEQAKAMLAQLSGNTHLVHTCVAATRVDQQQHRAITVTSEVRFAPLSQEWIDAYVESGEPMDKAGAYAIQGLAGSMIPSIHGSYTGIMGLPLYETLQLINALGRHG